MSRRRQRAAPISFFSFQDVMIGTIGVVLIITLVLLLNVGHRTIHAVAAAESTDNSALRAALESRIEVLADRVGIDELRNAVAKSEMEHTSQKKRNAALESTLDALLADREARFRTLHGSGAQQEAELLAIDADRLQQEVDSQQRRRRISYLIDDEQSDAIVAELMSGRMVISTTRASDVPQAVDSQSPASLAKLIVDKWLRDSAEQTTHLLISLKPSGLATWAEIERLRRTDPRLEDLAIGLDLIGESASTTEMFDAVETTP
ncbi:MAG: hypothetical protein HN811_03520 [Phycisphaerae bacterium]|nr:hypothetical protein [Phycisphaerae bacterium]MBT7351506.1 hypothetical protein [Phycisphaerae bacterium]